MARRLPRRPGSRAGTGPSTDFGDRVVDYIDANPDALFYCSTEMGQTGLHYAIDPAGWGVQVRWTERKRNLQETKAALDHFRSVRMLASSSCRTSKARSNGLDHSQVDGGFSKQPAACSSRRRRRLQPPPPPPPPGDDDGDDDDGDDDGPPPPPPGDDDGDDDGPPGPGDDDGKGNFNPACDLARSYC